MTATNKSSVVGAKVIACLYYAVAVGFLAYLFSYYWTGLGGPVVLAMTLVPVTFALFTLNALRAGDFYPRLPLAANYLIAAVYVGLSLTVAIYMNQEYEAIQIMRAGTPNLPDVVLSIGILFLILEYARKRHMPLFVLNIVLILYAAYGWIIPGMFHHPGLSWNRINNAMSLDVSTGVFADLPQLALTVVGAFLLVLSALRAFGCVDSILAFTSRIAVRSPYAIPQSAVLGSMCVGAVSGSGAANAITIGSATIPAMRGAGIPGATAAAIESASSMGGQFMPPVMGIAAFLMAEFLGKSYFDVVARGYVPALIYYVSVAVAVYLVSWRYRVHMVALRLDDIRWQDWINVASFLSVVAALILLMAVYHLAPLFAAIYVFIAIGSVLMISHIGAAIVIGQLSLQTLVVPCRRFIDIFCDMITDLTLLLATLSLMMAAMVITGVPTKLGALLIDAAGVNLAAMAAMAFIFGSLLGTGLPPAPTYIITALVIAPPFIRVGVDPWAVHFFAFFIAVWGELTPPTSIVAAITAKIAEASFMQVMGRMIPLCVCLFTLMVGVFVRPSLVVEPGMDQIAAGILILIATLGVTFAIQARFTDRAMLDVASRVVLAAFALVVLLHPSDQVAITASVPVGLFIVFWIMRRRAATPAGQLETAASRP